MSKENKDNKTIIYGDINAPTQIGGNDNTILTGEYDSEPKATYDITPIWRSPFTLAVLTWLSAIFGILSLIPFWSLLKSAVNLLKDASDLQTNNNIIPVCDRFCCFTHPNSYLFLYEGHCGKADNVSAHERDCYRWAWSEDCIQ